MKQRRLLPRTLRSAGKTFLDLIAEQIKHTRQQFGSKVRFILMNRCELRAERQMVECWCMQQTSLDVPGWRPMPPYGCRASGWPASLQERAQAAFLTDGIIAGALTAAGAAQEECRGPLPPPTCLPPGIAHGCSFSTSSDTRAYLGKSHGDLLGETDVELMQAGYGCCRGSWPT